MQTFVSFVFHALHIHYIDPLDNYPHSLQRTVSQHVFTTPHRGAISAKACLTVTLLLLTGLAAILAVIIPPQHNSISDCGYETDLYIPTTSSLLGPYPHLTASD